MNKPRAEFSKTLLKQESALIWIMSLSFIVLAFYCIHEGFMGSLPWLTASASLPWAAYGVSQVYYYKKSMAENTKNGVKYESVIKELDNAHENYNKIIKEVADNIIIEGDNNLISSNIKKDVTIFGVTGTLEEGTGGQKDNIEILHLSDLTSTSAVVTACDGLVEISQDGNLETFTKVAAYAYDTNPMGAYYAGGKGAGISFASSNKTNRAIFFTTPITITDFKILLKFIYYVSTLNNPTIPDIL